EPFALQLPHHRRRRGATGDAVGVAAGEHQVGARLTWVERIAPCRNDLRQIMTGRNQRKHVVAPLLKCQRDVTELAREVLVQEQDAHAVQCSGCLWQLKVQDNTRGGESGIMHGRISRRAAVAGLAAATALPQRLAYADLAELEAAARK